MRYPPPSFRTAPVALSSMLAMGCAEDTDPYSLLDDPRILTILAAPLELGPDEAVTLTPYVWTPPGTPVVAQTWSLCPLSLDSAAGFACAVPACEVPLAPEPDGRLVAAPREAIMACLTLLAAGEGGAPTAGFGSHDLPESLEVVFRYTFATADGFTRTGVRRVVVWLAGEPPSRNAAPTIARVEARLAGAAAFGPVASLPPVPRGGEVEVRVVLTEDSAESYHDDLGEPLTESPFVTFLATAGRFDGDRAAGLAATFSWQAKPLAAGDDAADVWVVANDGRGGQAIAGPSRLTIGP